MRALYRAAVGLVGTSVVTVGLVLVPLPGPGWAVVFLGLTVLASEFRWAEDLLRSARARAAALSRRWQRPAYVDRAVLVSGVLAPVLVLVVLALARAGAS